MNNLLLLNTFKKGQLTIMLTLIGKIFNKKNKVSVTADEMRDLARRTSVDNVPLVVRQILLLVSKEAQKGSRVLCMSLHKYEEHLEVCEFDLPYTNRLIANYELVKKELEEKGFRVWVTWCQIQVNW